MPDINPLQLFDPTQVPGANPLQQGAPSLGQAVNTAIVDPIQQWVAAERAKSIQMGLMDPKTGLPTTAGLVDAAKKYASGLLVGTAAPEAAPEAAGFTAYHGSPHSFDQFDTSKIGTGEGAQAYGYGLYLADKEGVARSYRDRLSEGPMDGLNAALTDFKPYNPKGPNPTPDNLKAMLAAHPNTTLQDAANNEGVVRDLSTMINGHDLNSGTWSDAGVKAASRIDTYFSNTAPSGHMYEVQVNANPEHFLDWNKPRDQQPANVQEFAKQNYPSAWDKAADGSSLYQHMVKQVQSE